MQGRSLASHDISLSLLLLRIRAQEYKYIPMESTTSHGGERICRTLRFMYLNGAFCSRVGVASPCVSSLTLRTPRRWHASRGSDCRPFNLASSIKIHSFLREGWRHRKIVLRNRLVGKSARDCWSILAKHLSLSFSFLVLDLSFYSVVRFHRLQLPFEVSSRLEKLGKYSSLFER